MLLLPVVVQPHLNTPHILSHLPAPSWWKEYAGRKNEEEDMVADSLM